MILSELKPFPEILSYLEGEKKIFLVGCKGCAEVCHTGDETQVVEMKGEEALLQRLNGLPVAKVEIFGYCIVSRDGQWQQTMGGCEDE